TPSTPSTTASPSSTGNQTLVGAVAAKLLMLFFLAQVSRAVGAPALAQVLSPALLRNAIAPSVADQNS
ncbi:MAG TPA: hypothetical protein VJ255_07515, partial [Candidatus Acidoferrum sp.]|nr:hypothetical protein [Candidatus Acidoferrum sp.]